MSALANTYEGLKSYSNEELIEIQNQVDYMVKNIQDVTLKQVIQIGSLVAVLLRKLIETGRKEDSSNDTSNLISMQHLQLVEKCCWLVMYAGILPCLDDQVCHFPKLTMMKRKTFVGGQPRTVAVKDRRKLLAQLMRMWLQVYKSPYGQLMRSHMTGETIAALMQLSFAPSHVKDEKVLDCDYFAERLDYLLMKELTPLLTVKHLLVLRSISCLNKGPSQPWFRRISSAIICKRFLLKEGGVRLVVGAALEACEGEDWRQREAAAAHLVDLTTHRTIRQIVAQLSEILLDGSGNAVVEGVVARALAELLKVARDPQDVLQTLLGPLLSLAKSKDEISVRHSVWRCVSVIILCFNYQFYVSLIRYMISNNHNKTLKSRILFTDLYKK